MILRYNYSLNSEGLLAFRITSIYDGKNNKPVEKISYGSNGSVMFKDKNQYDKNGNLIEKSRVDFFNYLDTIGIEHTQVGSYYFFRKKQ